MQIKQLPTYLSPSLPSPLPLPLGPLRRLPGSCLSVPLWRYINRANRGRSEFLSDPLSCLSLFQKTRMSIQMFVAQCGPKKDIARLIKTSRKNAHTVVKKINHRTLHLYRIPHRFRCLPLNRSLYRLLCHHPHRPLNRLPYLLLNRPLYRPRCLPHHRPLYRLLCLPLNHPLYRLLCLLPRRPLYRLRCRRLDQRLDQRLNQKLNQRLNQRLKERLN